MKLLILSDIHGERALLRQVWAKEHDADAVLFLGDGIRDVEEWKSSVPGVRLYAVRGNCDYGSPYPTQGLAAFDGVLFFYTHGHEFSVRGTPGILAQAAAARGAQAALFGHTHQPFCRAVDGVQLFNPGALAGTRGGGQPSYGVITTAPGGVLRCAHRVP